MSEVRDIVYTLIQAAADHDGDKIRKLSRKLESMAPPAQREVWLRRYLFDHKDDPDKVQLLKWIRRRLEEREADAERIRAMQPRTGTARWM